MKNKIALALGITLVAMATPLQQATAASNGAGADVARIEMQNGYVGTGYWSTCPGDWPPPPGVPCTYTSVSAFAGTMQVLRGSWLGLTGSANGNHTLSSFADVEQATITYPEDSYIYGGSDYSEPLYSSVLHGYAENLTGIKIDSRLRFGSLSATLNLRDCTDNWNGLADECVPLASTSTANFEWIGSGRDTPGRGLQPDPPMCNGPNGAWITAGMNWNIHHLDQLRRVDATVSGSATGFAPFGTLGGASLSYFKFAGLDIATGCPTPPPPQITFTHSYVPADQSGRTGTFVMDYDFADTPKTTALIARVTHDNVSDPNAENPVTVSKDFEVRVATPAGVTAGTYHFEVPVTVCDGDPVSGDYVTVQVLHDIKGNTDWVFVPEPEVGSQNFYYATESGGTCTLNGPF